MLKKYIRHIDISDNNGKNDDHLPAGEGAIDYTIYLDMLRKFRGLVVHEVHTPEDPVAASLRSQANLDRIVKSDVSRETQI